MKVYFEPTGLWGSKIALQVYVNPTGDGHADRYDMTGETIRFAWAWAERAYCYEQQEIPDALWHAIRHGCDKVYVPEGTSPCDFTTKPVSRPWTWDDVLVRQPFDPSDPADSPMPAKFVKPEAWRLPEFLKQYYKGKE